MKEQLERDIAILREAKGICVKRNNCNFESAVEFKALEFKLTEELKALKQPTKEVSIWDVIEEWDNTEKLKDKHLVLGKYEVKKIDGSGLTGQYVKCRHIWRELTYDDLLRPEGFDSSRTTHYQLRLKG